MAAQGTRHTATAAFSAAAVRPPPPPAPMFQRTATMGARLRRAACSDTVGVAQPYRQPRGMLATGPSQTKFRRCVAASTPIVTESSAWQDGTLRGVSGVAAMAVATVGLAASSAARKSVAPSWARGDFGRRAFRQTSIKDAAPLRVRHSSTKALCASPAASRMVEFRDSLDRLKVDAFIIPTDDPHLSEVPPTCFARRAFISGFTGSAGTAVITAREALLWTDGRYFLQAAKELPEGWCLMRSGTVGTPTLEEWLLKNLRKEQVVGIDPSAHSAHFVVGLEKKLAANSIQVRSVSENPVDTVWGDSRPPYPSALVRLHPEKFAGISTREKLASVRAAMVREGVGRLVVSVLDEVAYLFNVRGGDVWRTPFVLAYAVVDLNSATLFTGEAGALDEKVPADVRQALEEAGVELRPYCEVLPSVASPMPLTVGSTQRSVWLDPQRTNCKITRAVESSMPIHSMPSPLALMKARKNDSEMSGMRAAHRRDAAALVTALSRINNAVIGGTEALTEVDVDHIVTSCRAEQWGYVHNSFDTIAGYGPNGAIIHYSAKAATALEVGVDAPLLIDSGGQYVDGTTDVTRTVHFGKPDPFLRECFTHVLKGHIALATTVFPEGTPGFVLDVLARRSLWSAGLDYRHGTGHGVGAALAVHEGPQSISPRFDNTTPLEVGMIVSNEPGCYVEGRFGIRLENLMVVVERQTPHCLDGKKYFGFEPLTLVPIQRSLVDETMLTFEERAYFDAYHARIREEIAPLLSSSDADTQEDAEGDGGGALGGANSNEVLGWLLRATEPLSATKVPSWTTSEPLGPLV